MEALKGELTYAQISAKYGVHSTQINRWKQKLKAGMADVFSDKKQAAQIENTELVDDLYKQIGQLTVERDWLKKKSDLFS